MTEDQKACIQEISTKVMKQRAIIGGEDKIIDVEYVKIKLFDKQKALDSLSGLLGFNAAVKTDLTSNGQTILVKLPDPE